MQLTEVRVRNFRSLYDVVLPLKPLTILVGPNASGKSNLFKALRFLHDAVVGDVRDWQAYDAQIDDLLWYGLDERGERPSEIGFGLDFGRTGRTPAACYEATFNMGDNLTISHERLATQRRDGDDAIYPYFERSDDQVERSIESSGQNLLLPVPARVRSQRLLTLRDEGPSFQLPPARDAVNHITGWRFFDVDPAAARRDHFIRQYPEAVPPLDNNAGNLAAFLYALSLVQPDDYEAVVDALRSTLDLPQKVLVEHDGDRGGRNARYMFVEAPFGENRPIPPHSLSDGTIRFLAHLALLLADRSVTLACLEEMDHGLHPGMLVYLADLLLQVVSNPWPGEGGNVLPQVILTTHNAEFMDCFDLVTHADIIQVYIAERDADGKTVFVSTTAQQLAPWLEHYRLGEAVRRHMV